MDFEDALAMILLLMAALGTPIVVSQGEAYSSQCLDAGFFAEGATGMDVDGDGAQDVVAGPFWWAGPTFEQRFRYRRGDSFDVGGYSDHFFTWGEDVDSDGDLDIVLVGFPGAAAFWYQNPGDVRKVSSWERHMIHALVDNEAPAFVDLDGDGRRDLVFHSEGTVGWCSIPSGDVTEPWDFHVIAEDTGLHRYTHGLGVGDLTGDGHADLMLNHGWWEQPAKPGGVWEFHAQVLSKTRGGAQILIHDWDGDGDADIFTSLDAHGYGLSWFENLGREEDNSLMLKEHPVMGGAGSDLAGGLAISELHALTTADLDGDGLLDVVTGKRFMSHSFREAGSREPAWIIGLRQDPEQSTGFSVWPIHPDSGVGTQVCATDLNGDGHADFVTASKRGIFVHQRRPAGLAVELEGQEPVLEPESFPEGGQRVQRVGGGFVNLDFETGDLSDWTVEGEAFAGQPIRGDTVAVRRSDSVSAHAGSYWIGGYELHQDQAIGRMTSVAFTPPARWMAFLIAGGASHGTRLEVLAANGEVLFEAMGRNAEELRPAVIDLGEGFAAPIQIVLVDEEAGGWGHLNVDHFRFYDQRPEFPEGQEVQVSRDRIVNQGLSPIEGAAAMTVPEGFHVDLIAGEPDLHQPIALWIDDGGRLWVAEAYSYPKKRPAGEGHDRILIFEDADQDGSFETKKVFYEGLNLVSGLAVGFGGVFVGQAPELLFIPDRNADDEPDGPPVVLLDGWGYEDTHETLNAFTFGPDGWLYGCHGVFTHSRVGAPGTPDEQRVPINAGVWRFHPTSHHFEVFAEGTSNPWGVDFNAQGEVFVSACVIPHFYHLVPGARYHRQAGAHFSPYIFEDLPTIADHRHFIGDNPHGGTGRSDLAGGGHAHCGLLIYQGQQFPEQYQGGALFFNVHGNRMNHDHLTPDGATWIASHRDDLMHANDTWFRGIAARTGPEGEVFFIDWYDPQACHHNDTEIWNRTNGRLYRLRYGDQGTSFLDLRQSSPQELVELALTGSTYASRRARRRCQERGLAQAEVESVVQRMLGDVDSSVRLRALWLLQSCGKLGEPAAGHVMTRDENSTVRAWAVRALGGRLDLTERMGELLVLRASGDSDPVVLRELASAIQRLPDHLRWDLINALALNEAALEQNSVELLIWYGLEPLVPKDPERALALARSTSSQRLASFVVRRCAVLDEAMPALVSHLSEVSGELQCLQALDALLQALGERRGVRAPAGWNEAYEQLAASKDSTLVERAVLVAARFGDVRAFETLRVWLATGEDNERTRLAFEVLVEARDSATQEILLSLIQHSAWQQDVLRALGSWPGPRTTGAVLANWSEFSPAAQREAVATLTSNPDGARAVLKGIQSGALGGREVLAPTDARRIVEMGPELTDLLGQVWGTLRPLGQDRVQQISEWKEILTVERLAGADLQRGRAVFAKTCQRCHELYGIGETVGPELTGSNRADLDYILRNLIDPSAEIPAAYRATIVATHEGRIINGVLLRETEEILVLATETGTLELDQGEVEARRTDPNSLMPEGQLGALGESEAVDLIAYLGSKSQVSRRLLPGEEAEWFNGVNLAGWSGTQGLWTVADGVIVGRAEALEHNEYLLSDYDLKDFRLVLEMRLTPDSANSGIQVRSQPFEEHSVQGYQADASKGIWGTLYEVHGRGLMVGDVPQPQNTGGWNTYEILCVGTHVQIALNGLKTVDLDDPKGAAHGRVGFQLHQGQAMTVQFRKLRLELNPTQTILQTLR
ncbi:MAG TPA: DUF1080 domain-containing protein [Planctomycetes bacterium]|nr:DUF1080 domain-containing protein [Planctomycetota bacterium]